MVVHLEYSRASHGESLPLTLILDVDDQYAAAEEVCYLVILDASLIGCKESPPLVARLRLPAKYAFPYGFHGVWTDLQNAHPSTSSSSANHADHPTTDD